MINAQRQHLIPTQRFGLSAGLAAIITLILLPVLFAFGPFLVAVAPLLTGFSSALIFGTSKTHGLVRSMLAGFLGQILTYVIPVLLSVLGIPITPILGLFIYLIVILFPLGVVASALGGVIGWAMAPTIGR